MNLLNRFKTHKMPEQSFFYDRVVPALLIFFALVTGALILFAVGVFTGLVVWT